MIFSLEVSGKSGQTMGYAPIGLGRAVYPFYLGNEDSGMGDHNTLARPRSSGSNGLRRAAPPLSTTFPKGRGRFPRIRAFC
jgi:hypothetical protein